MPIPAVIGAAAIGAGASLIGSSQAARAQRDAANQASSTELAMFNQNRADQEPWRNAGTSALSQLLSDLGLEDTAASPAAGAGGYFDQGTGQWVEPQAAAPAQRREGYGQLLRNFSMSDYEADPGVGFRRQQGEQAINRNALARGRYNSGGTLKELRRYNSDLASQEYGAAYDRFNQNQGNRFNRLASIAGVGQTATNTLNADRSATAGRIGENTLQAGNAAAAGWVGGANAVNQGLSSGVNYWQQQQMLNQLRKPSANVPSYMSGWNA